MVLDRRSRMLGVGAVLCASVSLSTVAWAQSSTVPMPVRTYVDENGVDMFSGTRIIDGPVLNAGPDARLSYHDIWSSTGNANQSVQGAINGYNGSNGSIATVSIGAMSEKFLITGQFQYQPTEARGSTLVYGSTGWVYTRSDGTVYTFQRDNSCCQVVYRQWGDVPVIRSIRYKDGTLITYNWVSYQITVGQTPSGPLKADVKRVAAIYSNSGYALNLQYQNQPSTSDQNFAGALKIVKVIANNTSLDNCTNGVCTAGNRPYLSGGYTYAPNGTTVTGGSSTTSANQTTTVTSSTVQAPGESASYTYDSANRVMAATSQGVTTNYGYSDSGDIRTITVSTANSPPRTLTFNIAQSTLRSDTDETNRTTSYEYDNSARVTKITAPENNFNTFVYDTRGNVTNKIVTGKTGATLSTSASFPCSIAAACNSPVSTTDARNNTTNYDYDPTSGLPTKITWPTAATNVRPEQRIGYTQIGGIWRTTSISRCMTAAPGSCIGSSDEIKTIVSYAGNSGLAASVTEAAGDNSLSATSTMTYDDMGYQLTVDGPLPGSDDKTRYYYDGIGQLLGGVGRDPDGSGALLRRAVRNTYNSAGQITLVETGTATDQSDGALTNMAVLRSAATSYDGNSRLVAQSVFAGSTTYAYTQTSYDARGRVDCVATRMNPGAFTSTGNACALGSQGSDGPDRIRRTSYDNANRVLSVTTALGTAEATTESSTYTTNGKIASVTDGNGNVTSYAYDGYDRLATTTYPGGSYEQLSYEAGGNVTSRRLRDGQVIGYGYDALGRLVSKDVPNQVYWETDKGYGYNLIGQLTSAWDSNGRNLGFVYDALARKTSQSDNWYGFGNASFLYDTAGRRTRLTWGDGAWMGYDYLATGEVSTIRDSAGNALVTFGYDDLGRRTSLSRANGTTTTYGYDSAGRLTGLNLNGGNQPLAVGLSYNPANQITSRNASNDAYAWTGAYNVDRSYGVNGLNQYTSAGSVALGYDGRGNLTTSGSAGYGYTSENRLATAPGASLAYDPMDRLFNVNAEGGVNTTLLYDGADVIAEVDQANGALLRRYVPSSGTDEPLLWYEGAGFSDRRWLHADERGSIVAVTNNAGNAIAINRYDEFGIPQSGNLGRFQYTGQKWLPTVGLYDYKARMYSPTLGRFMQTDPIGYGDGLNLYNYVGSDPVNNTDPTGLACQRFTHTRFQDINNNNKFDNIDRLIFQIISYSSDCYDSTARSSETTPNLRSNSTSTTQNGEDEDIVVTGTRLPTVDVSPQPQFFSIAGNIWDSGLPRDVDQLKSMLEDAKRAKDTQLQRRIIKQLKAADARNIGKLRGLGKFRAFPFFFFIPDVLRIQMCSMPGNTDPTCPSGA